MLNIDEDMESAKKKAVEAIRKEVAASKFLAYFNKDFLLNF